MDRPELPKQWLRMYIIVAIWNWVDQTVIEIVYNIIIKASSTPPTTNQLRCIMMFDNNHNARNS